ncbi:hypothetical protein [Haloferula sargassicola]|uniref:Uncharacterized protein n=1 Tax=Haloferula sargassicola TaxID=490096 RepID=A0ABP9UUW3_9BACT
MKPHLFLASLSILPAFGGEILVPETTGGNWQWSISAGPSYRHVGSLEIHSGSRSSAFPLPSLVGSDVLSVPPIGDLTDSSDRTYDDGYVRQDAGTAADGSTWNWGYDHPGQIQGDQLVFSATGARSIRSDLRTAPAFGPSRRDSLRGIAPHLQLDGVSPREIGGFRLGLSAGFDFTQVDQSTTFSNFAVTQTRDDYRIDFTDAYDLNGVIPPLAPYAGSYGGPGPLIHNLPSHRISTETLINSESALVTNRVSSAIDIDVFSLTLGPTLSRRQGPFDYSVQAGVILNVYHWQARQGEQLNATTSASTATLARWNESDSGTKFRPGVFAQGDMAYRISEDVSIGAYLRLDLATEFRAQAGPTVYRVAPTGLSTGLMLRYQLP